MTTWHTKVTLRAVWSNAPASDTLLDELLDVAKHQVLEFAPTLAAEAPIPTQYRYAQYMQAMALWNAQKAGPTDDAIGGESYQVRVYPMDATIRRILRPTVGVPRLG